MNDEARPLAIVDYDDKPAVSLTDDERWPHLSAPARARLDAVRHSARAPTWRHEAGHRLDADGIARARRPLPVDGWLEQHLARARALPAYRGFPGPLEVLDDFPLIDRDDLLRDIGGFVPLGADLDRMTQGTSSGSTGRALLIPEDPEEVARTFWLVHDLVEHAGVPWAPDPKRLGLANVVDQARAYTYASAMPGFGDAVMTRLNLFAGAWDAEDRVAFLAEFDPQVISGSPASLSALLDPALVAVLHPIALVSGATHLTPGLRRELESAYRCPVLELYGLHETRPIGVSTDGGPFVLLDRRILVEIMDAAGEVVQNGNRGEIVVTAGENPLLPLVRYRTGDYGRIVPVDGRLAIADLEGREDVEFTGADGVVVRAVDVTQQLQAAGAHGWVIEQDATGRVNAIVAAGDRASAEARLVALFGPGTVVGFVDRISQLGAGKPRRYHRG